jgi:hypothetical protein
LVMSLPNPDTVAQPANSSRVTVAIPSLIILVL